MTTILSVQNVTKRIGRRWIIKGISFEIRAGEVFGFLGPNGSGKTTTIRMLVDLIKPTSGTIKVCGHDVHRDHDQALQQIGAIVENPELYNFLTGWENLEQFARMTPGIADERLHEVTEIVGMEQRIHDKVKTYSLGMRQRLGIAQALLGRPQLLILDEPTNGLDPQGIRELREFIRRLADTGMSLFISSHLLHEIQMLCDRVAIISRGELLAVGDVQELLQQKFPRIIWHVDLPDRARQILSAYEDVDIILPGGLTVDDGLEWIDNGVTRDVGLDGIDSNTSPGTDQITTQMDRDLVPKLNRKLVDEGIMVYGIEIKQPSLEQLFLDMTEGEVID